MNAFVHLAKFIIILGIMAPLGHATELNEIYYGARPFGMGNAYTAIANDEYSAFTNPAGITRARKHRSRETMHLFKFPNVTIGSNGSTEQIIDFQNGEQTTEDLVAEAAEDNGKPLWVFGGLYPVGIFELSNQSVISIGGFAAARGFVYIDGAAPQNTSIESTIDLAGIINLGFSNNTNRLNFGISLRPTQRFAYEDTIPTEELSNTAAMQNRIQLDSNSMNAFALDAGMMFTFADFWFPTLGFSIMNVPTGCQDNFLNPYSKKSQTICGTIYQRVISDLDNQPLSSIDPTDIRVGFSITPRISRKLAMRLAVDVHHLPVKMGNYHLGYDGIEVGKLLHAGAELFAGNPLERNNWAVRIGVNQGHYTMGATVKFSLFAFEFATFGQDISSGTSPREDRRFLGNFSIEF